MHKLKTFREEKTNVAAEIAAIQANRTPMSILLDGVQDVRNVGAMIRTADGARLQKVYVYNVAVPFEPRKLKRYSRNAHLYVELEYLNTLEQVQALRQTHRIVALDITTQSVPYTDLKPSENPTLIVVGSERAGISPAVLALADETVHLPMLGINLSLNVTTAGSILIYHLLEQYQSSI